MNARIDDLMAKRVITAQRHHTVDHVARLMKRNRVHAIPIVDDDRHAVGVVTSTDLIAATSAATPVSEVMSAPVHAVPAYNDVHVAARIMRNHRIHHVVVTHEKKVVGLISSFDLLRLVEEHRFIAKNGPTERRPRSRSEAGPRGAGLEPARGRRRAS